MDLRNLYDFSNTQIISLHGISPFFFATEMQRAYIEVGKNDIYSNSGKTRALQS